MADLEHRNHSSEALGVPVELVWTGEFWDVFHGGTRIGILAESYPVMGEPQTSYVAKLAGEENVADGFVSTEPEEAIAALIESAGL